jgi:1-acyl-sn-glycerol-3-phosphate acyltransferase
MYTLIGIFTALLSLFGRLLYRMRVEGVENLPEEGPYIVSSNEIGRMGSIMTSVFIARRILRGLTVAPVGFAEEYEWSGMWGPVYDRGSARPIFPHGRGQGVLALLTALRSLREGKIVMMNPGGEMSWDGRLVPAKRGVAWLGLRSGAPIVLVVATKGAYQVWPKWAKRPQLTGRFQVRVGKPFRLTDSPCSKVSDEMIAGANQRIAEEMTALIYR